MKIVGYFKENCSFYYDDINELALFLEHSPLIEHVVLDLDLDRIEFTICKEEKNEI